MTNVPGIVPQPYPIVNYPGTFAIILRKVATPVFFLFFCGEPSALEPRTGPRSAKLDKNNSRRRRRAAKRKT